MAKNDQPTENKLTDKVRKTNGASVLVVGALLLILFGGVFYAGALYDGHHGDGPHGYSSRRTGFAGSFGQHLKQHRHQPFEDNVYITTGKVTSVSGSEFKIDANGTTKTVKTSDKTRTRGIGIAGLKNGDQVVVFGQDKDNVIDASLVRLSPETKD